MSLLKIDYVSVCFLSLVLFGGFYPSVYAETVTFGTTKSGTSNLGSTTGDPAKWARSFSLTVGATDITPSVCLTKYASPADNVEFAIQADSAGSPSGTDLGTASSVAYTAIGTADPCTTLTTASAITTTLSSGTTYWLVLRRSGANDATNKYGIAYQTGSGLTTTKYTDASAPTTWNLHTTRDLVGNVITTESSSGGGTSTSTATSTLSTDGATIAFLLIIMILVLFLMVVGFMYNSFSVRKY